MMRLGRSRVRLALALALSMLALASPLAANPFLSSGEDAPAVPTIRTPTSQGPMVESQRGLRERTAEAIGLFARDPSGATLAALLGAAMLYGILHAAGPGHRKTVVFSLFLGKRSKPWEPLAAGFLSAGVHAGVGMALVGSLSLAYGAIAGLGDTERLAAWLDAATFGLLSAMAIVLIVAKIVSMVKGAGSDRDPGKRRSFYGLIIVSSMVPCPGATMLLLFSLYAGLPWLGGAAVLAMSLGMGLVISAAGYLAYAGREGLFGRLKNNERTIGMISNILELCSYMLILGFSLYMSWPMIAGAALAR